jgi:DNA modification methylase
MKGGDGVHEQISMCPDMIETKQQDKAPKKEKEKPNMDYCTATKAMQILGLSRHTFEKTIKKGQIIASEINGKRLYLVSALQEFMQTNCYNDLVNGSVDPRNSLNDLTGKEWLPETKSYLYQKGLGANHPEAQIEKLHPAPYSFQDIGRLIRFFTKSGMIVLDPFGGVGSTAKACEVDGRKCISIELSPVWHDLSIKRLETEVGEGTSSHHHFINGDSCTELPKLPTDSVDFMVTSPPYWGILHKKDQKVIKNRVANNLETHYSDSEQDLGNVESYTDFLEILVNKVFIECARTLRPGRYMAIVVSDFRDKNKFISFHCDLINALNRAAIPDGGILTLQGTKILIQNHKSLLPYGYPFSYVENIHHQYILIFRKEKKAARKK